MLEKSLVASAEIQVILATWIGSSWCLWRLLRRRRDCWDGAGCARGAFVFKGTPIVAAPARMFPLFKVRLYSTRAKGIARKSR